MIMLLLIQEDLLIKLKKSTRKLAFNPKPPLEMSKDIIFPMEDINTPKITTIKTD